MYPRRVAQSHSDATLDVYSADSSRRWLRASGTDDDCALDGARPCHPETSFDDGVLLARLDYSTLIFHTPAVAEGLRCNNATYLFAEQSKYNLQLSKHTALVRRASSRSGRCTPTTLSVALT